MTENTAGFWHIEVELGAGKDVRKSCANDLSFEQLRTQVLEPWHSSRPFTVAGLLVRYPDKVVSIRIVQTTEPMQTFADAHNAKMGAQRILDMVTDRCRLPFRHGVDRTQELLFAADEPAAMPFTAGAKEAKAMNGISVFVSHSAKDGALAKAFVDCVEACIEVPDKALRCTSVPGYKLAPGDVSDEVLRDNLEHCAVVIGLLTEESLKSGYVIMELGAAWGLKKTTCALLAPKIDYARVPGPLARRHAVMVDSDHDISSVMEVIADKTGWPLRNRAKSTAAVTTFVTVAKTAP